MPPPEPAPPPAAVAEPPPTTPVIWTHRAERKLHTELCRCKVPTQERAAVRDKIDGWLGHAFRGATSVVALEVYLGFRPRNKEYILFVDVRGGPHCGTAIVKMADDCTRLEGERTAWEHCAPVCFPGNAVFMGLQHRRDGAGRLVALVYQDAQPHIGTDEIVWLETAVVRAVRFGSPDTHTVIDVIRELFGHLGRVMYGAARVDPIETGGAIELNPRADGTRRRLCDFFGPWRGIPDPPEPNQPPQPPQPPNHEPLRVRQQVQGVLVQPDRYLDPVDYFESLESELGAGRAELALPRRLRGPAHGDLHGRNVLVGVEADRAGTPAVFDYENMSNDNLLGFDFVKLETELKIRALDAIVRERLPDEFAARVERFESRLAERTTACRNAGVWPDGPDPNVTDAEAARFDRLEAIVLSIRGQAAEHLGARRGRSHEWLHEYYFLLGCYGVSTARFANQNNRERAAALVSAGVAAALYHAGRPVALASASCTTGVPHEPDR